MNEIIVVFLSNQWWDYISFLSLIISLLALWITWKMFWLKSWDKYKVIGYTSRWSIENSDTYISSITIQNLKDKPLVVFKIYFKLWYNLFIELEDFEDKPLIIKPFEVYQWNYWPILFYSDAWFKKFNVNKLFKDEKVKNNIILETIEWKYKKFYVLGRFFKNYYTWIIEGFKLFHNDKSYWDKIDYIVDITYDDWKIESIKIYKENDFKVFKNFKLYNKYLKSAKILKKYLDIQKDKWNIVCNRIDVIDWKKTINKRYNYNKIKSIKIEKVWVFQYHIWWKVYTFMKKIKTNIINSKIYRKFKK